MGLVDDKSITSIVLYVCMLYLGKSITSIFFKLNISLPSLDNWYTKILKLQEIRKIVMSFNNKAVDIYLSNIYENGDKKLTWVWLAKKHNISKVTLSRISSIRKYSDDTQFNIFLECMRGEETVLLSNGTSSHNIDHIALLLREGNTIVGKGKVATTTNVRSDKSCLYLLHSNRHYKIGVTLDSSINRRVAQLQIGNPYVIEVLAKTGTISNAYEIEKKLHKKFKDNKVRGEWFTLSSDELEYIIDTISKAK